MRGGDGLAAALGGRWLPDSRTIDKSVLLEDPTLRFKLPEFHTFNAILNKRHAKWGIHPTKVSTHLYFSIST
jgi:hypothetical protein